MENAKYILELLDKNEICFIETERDILTIAYKKFFRPDKEYLFVLNGKATDSCKGRKTASKKIEKYIAQGFVIAEDYKEEYIENQTI